MEASSLPDNSIHPQLQPQHAQQQSDLPGLTGTPSGRYNPYPLPFASGANGSLQKASHSPNPDGLDADSEENKPPVGSEEWHRMRRSNHKEVERRRRETINEGINELAKLISKEYPGAEKNKGAVLARAVQYIQQLKENEAINIERWTLEKLLCDQTIAELTAKNEKLRAECERAWREVGVWRKAAAGDDAPAVDGKDAAADEEE